MSQQQFSYFDPEQETVYKPRLINRDLRELQEYQEAQAETAYYVTPEQSMLRGEKLIPTHTTPSHANWIATTLFLLMLLFGTFIWAHEVLPAHSGFPPHPSPKQIQYPQKYPGQLPPWGGPYHKHHMDPDDQ